MEYISVQQAAEQWALSGRRVRSLCKQGKIEGVIREGRSYKIPANTVKPLDGRILRGKSILQEHTTLFARVDALKAQFSKRRPFTHGELRRLQKEFLVEFTYNSNAIEGNILTLQETALVVEGVTIDHKPIKDHLEAVGHRDAFLYVQQLVKEKAPMSEKIIKDIHSLVLMDRPDDKGVYRKVRVRIIGACHEPPQPHSVPARMEQFIATQREVRRHPIEDAALFHLGFEGIHPFIDGNGRTGRLLLNLMLMQQGYPPIDVKFVDRKQYYACFDSYYKYKTAMPMVEMVSKYLEEQLGRYLNILK